MDKIAAVLKAHRLTWRSDPRVPWFECHCGQGYDTMGEFTDHQAERITQLPLAFVPF